MEMNPVGARRAVPVQIINQPHPLIPSADRAFSAQGWQVGETARDALLRAGLDPHTEIVIMVNDRMLTVEEWDSVCPQPGDLVHAVAALSGSGGDGGSNPLKIVLTIVVMVVAWYAAPALGAMMGATEAGAAMGLSAAAWTGIAAGVITLAGNLIIGAIFQPSTGALSQANGSSTTAANSPTYSLSGGSNSIRPYSPMVVVMGTHRLFPDYAAKPYTEFQGEDQYLYQAFNFGLSTLSITDLHIGDSALANYSDVSLHWSDAAGNLPGFPGNVDSETGGKLTRGADWLVRTSAINTMRLAVDVEGSAFYSGDAGLLSCTVRIEAQYCPSGTGAWAPMMFGTEVSVSDSYWSLQTSSLSENGTSQVVQHAYAAAGHYEGEQQQVAAAMPLWNGGTAPAVYGTWTQASFGNGFPNDGPVTTYSTVSYIDINHGASQSPQRKTFAISVAKGIYDVRVRLTSATKIATVPGFLGITHEEKSEIADGDTRGGYSYSFSTLRSYQEDAAAYNGQTRLGMVIKATGQLNGVVQRLSALVSAYTNVYVGGVRYWQPSSNPAWWYLDFARGRMDSAGRQMYGCHLDDSQIDIAGITAWAAFCVAEGVSINLVLDSPQSGSDTLADIARCGLASPSWASGKLGIVWDKRNASPVAAFGMSNIMKGSFSVKYITENLADEIVVSYVDSEREWTQQQVRKIIPGVTNPQRTSTLEIKGCTNAALAGKHANLQAAAQVYRRRQITWDTDMEGFVCQRGDVVLLQHDLTQWGYSGRLVGVAGSVITLDRQVPRSGAVEYVMLASPDGSMQTWAIAPGAGDMDTLTLPAAPALQAGVMLFDHRWFFSPLPTPGKKVKLVSVKPVSHYRIQIVATDDEPEFYAAWDGTFTNPSAQTLLKNTVPELSSLTISEALVRTGPSTLSNRITISFVVAGTFDVICARYRIADGPWASADIPSAALNFNTEETGLLEVEAAAAKGVSLGAKLTGRQVIYGKTAPPADVPWLSLNGNDLSWGGVTDLDLSGYLVKFQYGNNTEWGTATPLHSGLLSASPYPLVSRPTGTTTIMIRAVDTSGNESKISAYLVTDLGDALVANVVEDFNFKAAGWPGSVTSATISGGNLLATQSDQFFRDDAADFFGLDGAPFYSTNFDAMTWASTEWAVSKAAAGSNMTISWGATGNALALEYRPTGPTPFFAADLSPFFATDSAEFYAPSPDWMTWPGSIVAESQGYQFRVTTGPGPAIGLVSDFTASVDVPDRGQRFADATIAAGGTRLSSVGFSVIENILLTLHGGSAAVMLEIADRNAMLGPLIIARNSSGTSVAATIDAQLQGY